MYQKVNIEMLLSKFRRKNFSAKISKYETQNINVNIPLSKCKFRNIISKMSMFKF